MSESRAAYEIRINEVLNYVDAHYAEPLALERMADVAHFSPYHFHRLFRGAVGESPHGYLMRIRLEKAVNLMNYGPNRTLTEVALECGFGSSSHFSRCFRERYGFSPKNYTPERLAKESKIRQDLLTNAGYSPRVSSEEANPDRFRVEIEERPAIRLAYVRVMNSYKPENIVSGLERVLGWARINGFWPGGQLIGRSRDNAETTPKGKYRYDWCVVIPNDFKPDGEVSFGRLAAHRFAVLHCHGDIHKVFRAWFHLYRDWLPDSGYQPADEAAMEVFHGEHELSADAIFDMDCCIPITELKP
jgi:AraC family transcriptional regulator